VCHDGDTVVAWTSSQESAQLAATHGADRVLCLKGSPRPEDWVDTIVERAKQAGPVAILLGATKRVKELAARVAASLDTGLSSECVELSRAEGFSARRYVYGGLCIVTEDAQAAPFMATMARGATGALAETAPVGIEEVEVVGESRITVTEFREHQGTVNLADAKAIVCVGRGVAHQEDLDLVGKLATALSAEVACSRPVAEELHWMPEERYIGMSGQVVKPDLYVGVGVSGQVQHMSGLRDAKLIVGIDKNENAPIVAASDYALVGDLYEIVPLLTESLS
jgi:electron transfer flavoprotein alpha subunit